MVTDGSPEAMATARWLERHGVKAAIVEARGAADVGRVVDAKRNERPKRRVVSLSQAPAGADVSASDALALIRSWTADLAPIRVRTAGADVIEARRRDAPVSAAPLDALLATLSPVPVEGLARGRRGRPRGTNPFRGVGFDTCVALLLEPERRWTERDLAEATGRSRSSIHTVLGELARRGYLLRTRGASRARDPVLLRDDLLSAWRAAVGVPRPATSYVIGGGVSLPRLLDTASRGGGVCLLAGPSAVTGPDAPLDDAVTIYCNDVAREVLGRAGIDRIERGRGDLIVWEAPERGVFSSPALVRGRPATNRVVTFLDLALSGDERLRGAAQALWRAAEIP
jgi:hypothetical protein